MKFENARNSCPLLSIAFQVLYTLPGGHVTPDVLVIVIIALGISGGGGSWNKKRTKLTLHSDAGRLILRSPVAVSCGFHVVFV